MKLWILRADESHDAWNPWYDKAFGYVVAAPDEKTAREIVANASFGDEGKEAWLELASCDELRADDFGDPTVVIADFHSA